DNNEMRVGKIKNGTVIDHIPSGKALDILQMLHLSEKNNIISILINAPSSKYGKKDILKIENLELDSESTNRISLLAPNATINIIRNFEIIEKRQVSIPDTMIGIIPCINPNCISRNEREHIQSIFSTISRDPLLLKCNYCGKQMDAEEITMQLKLVYNMKSFL
ncbi:MAG: aspartate carbamoyltransferase regulatory subunit, partial [Thermoplasmata archaeon]